MVGFLDRWRELTPEQKEIVLTGVHGTILTLIACKFRREGQLLRRMVIKNPGLALAGVVIGVAYFAILSRILGEH